MSNRIKQRVTINGIERWVTGDSVQDVIETAALMINQAEKQMPALQTEKQNAPTLAEFVRDVYKPTYFQSLAPTTQTNYEMYFNLNILPYLGGMRMDEITVATIQQWRNWMATASQHGRKKDLNRKSIERVTGLAGRIFRIAHEMKIIDDTPFKRTLLPAVGAEAGHHTALSDAEVDRLKREIPRLEDANERVFAALLVYTGMRPEEILGLMWEDINLEAHYGIVQRAVTYPHNSMPHIGKTKTEKSARTILIPSPLSDILKPLAKESGFILTGKDGISPCCYSRRTRIFNDARKHLHVKDFAAYDFRTTFGTQMCEQGITAKQCADLMGHTDTRMVETVYARTRHDGVMRQLELLEAMNKNYTAKARL